MSDGIDIRDSVSKRRTLHDMLDYYEKSLSEARHHQMSKYKTSLIRDRLLNIIAIRTKLIMDKYCKI